jgi:hypothetical protein
MLPEVDVKGLIGLVGALEEGTVPVLSVRWGRVMVAIARALGVKKKEVPHWPNLWNRFVDWQRLCDQWMNLKRSLVADRRCFG